MSDEIYDMIAKDFIDEVTILNTLVTEIKEKSITHETELSFFLETGLKIVSFHGGRQGYVVYAKLSHSELDGLCLRLSTQLSDLPLNKIKKIISLLFAESLLNDWMPKEYQIPNDYVFAEITNTSDPELIGADILAQKILELSK